MFDWSQMRDLIWEARWDAIVMVAQALWSNIVSYWWVGPLLLFTLLTLNPSAWLRLLRYVGFAFLRGHSGG